ncbi:MAG: hypothetical protein E7675_05015 [Ruminococcaceae bacterium]|nr:hypothetical protein [Oscillospiraceae bacterium]
MNNDNNKPCEKYKITNQSGLYYESDISRIIDDHISDKLFTRLVRVVLSISMAVTIWSSYLSGAAQPISCSALIAAIVLYIICGILYNRTNVLLSLYKENNEAVEKAIKARKAFVIIRYSVLAFSILSVVLSVIGL